MGCKISSCIFLENGGAEETSPHPRKFPFGFFKPSKTRAITSALTYNENEIDLSHFTAPEKVIGLGGFGYVTN